MPIDADWEGLWPNANRVKKVTYEEAAPPPQVPTSILPILAHRSTRERIFPNLTHLVWKCNTPDGLDHGKTFLGIHLESLTLEIGHNISNLADFLADVSLQTRLTTFSLSSLGQLPEDFLRAMIPQNLLEKVSIIAPGALDPKVGTWVSELPELKYLRLDLTCQSMKDVEGFFGGTTPRSGWTTLSSEEFRDSGVFPELDLTETKKINGFSGSGNARRGAYPQLKQLHLTGEVGNIVTFLKFLVGHIHTLELTIEGPPMEYDWQNLCAVICNKLSGSLRSLRILSTTPVDQVKSPRSPGRSQDQIFHRLPLSHFTSLPRLAEFEIDLPEPVIFDNSDIAHLATVCPAVEVLKLCPQAKWPSNYAPPGVTLVRYLS